jgi:dihydropteroate synthase
MLRPIYESHTMGVINLTPNSFSDGGKFLELESLISTIESFKQYPDLIFDFGFESTAPMNKAIDSMTEKSRMMSFLNQISQIDLSNRWISIDTYQLSNFLFLYGELKKLYPTCGIILNDVSGVLDRALSECLSLMKQDKNFYYIYSATHIPDRKRVLEHMNFISKENAFNSLTFKLENFFKWIDRNHFNSERIILDPALGFSKSFDQNWQLIDGMKSFFDTYPKYKEFIWLFGFSKKSFMQKKFPNSIDPKIDSEILHAKLVRDFLTIRTKGMIFRVHDPIIVKKSL